MLIKSVTIRGTTGGRIESTGLSGSDAGARRQEGVLIRRLEAAGRSRTAAAAGRWTEWKNARLIVLLVAVALTSIVVTSGSAVAINWMETPEFCTQCHTMQPQFLANGGSAHNSVKCGECHVGEGVSGFLRSKWEGTFELLRQITNTYQRPIPPASPQKAEVAAANCLRCHREPDTTRDRLLMRRHFDDDEKNTEQLVALVVRLADGNAGNGRGIHWHAKTRVEFRPTDESDRQIDYVRVTESSGQVKEYVSKDILARSETTRNLVGELRNADYLKRMDCLSCHNRVGHEFLSPGQALDNAISMGKIDKALPFVKREGMALLDGNYGSLKEATTAISRLEDYYRQKYPSVYEQKREPIDRAVHALQAVYSQVANPDMRATYESYPTFLGHQDSLGCFRCHDGGHFLLDRGQPTKTVIPFNCSLCHTFPQKGESVRSLPVGPPPETHGAKLWLVDHKGEAGGSLDIAKTSCNACHSQSYCTNCHATRVTHDNMRFDHVAVVKERGESACAYCHQRPSCARCHDTDVWQTPQAHPVGRRRRGFRKPIRIRRIAWSKR